MGDWNRYFEVIYKQHFPRLNTPGASLEDFVEIMRELWTLIYWAVQESARNGQLETCGQKVRELLRDVAQTPAFNQHV